MGSFNNVGNGLGFIPQHEVEKGFAGGGVRVVNSTMGICLTHVTG